MNPFGALPPHLTEFLREQLTNGRFRSEDELVRTALDALEGQVHAPGDAAWLKAEIEKGVRSRPAEPATSAFWDGLRARVRAQSGDGG